MFFLFSRNEWSPCLLLNLQIVIVGLFCRAGLVLFLCRFCLPQILICRAIACAVRWWERLGFILCTFMTIIFIVLSIIIIIISAQKVSHHHLHQQHHHHHHHHHELAQLEQELKDLRKTYAEAVTADRAEAQDATKVRRLAELTERVEVAKRPRTGHTGA